MNGNFIRTAFVLATMMSGKLVIAAGDPAVVTSGRALPAVGSTRPDTATLQYDPRLAAVPAPVPTPRPGEYAAASHHLQRLEQLEAEIATLKNRIDDRGPACVAPCTKCSDCYRPGWYAGYEFLFVKQHLKESYQASRNNLATGATQLVPFSQSYELTPRAWLGYSNSDGLGARMKYWQYDHNGAELTLAHQGFEAVGAQSITVIVPATISTTAPGQVLTVNNGLNLQTLDLEGTQRFRLGKASGLFGVGLRYASLDQTYHATTANTGGLPPTISWNRDFEGLGLLLSGEAVRPLGNTGLSGFAGFSGWLLYGRKDFERLVIGSVDPLPVPPMVEIRGADEVVGGGEVSLGLDWRRCLTIGEFHLRGTYTGQLWTDAGAPTLTFLGFEGFGLTAELRR